MSNSVYGTCAELRHLGLLEQYSVARSNLGVYNNVCVTATYWRESVEMLKPALSRALAAVTSKHPILSAVPVDTSTAPRFLRLQRIVVDQVLTITEYKGNVSEALFSGALDKLLQGQHNTPFRHEEPLVPFWRLHALENPADTSTFILNFCFHHSLADTKSALVFLEDLEHELGHPQDIPPPRIISPSNESLLPSMESIYEFQLFAPFLARQQRQQEPPEDVWSGRPQAIPTTTRFASTWLSSTATRNLKRLSQEQGSSLTATIMSITAASFFDILPSACITLHGHSAVSLRRFLPAPITPRSMGCYVGSFSETYSRQSNSIWEEARRTKSTIESVVNAAGRDMEVGYLRHIPDITAWLKEKMGKRRWAAWELSNVGTLSSLERNVPSRCEIQSLLFSQSAGACSGAVKISAASGRDGKLSLGFSWQEGIVEDIIVQQLMARMMGVVEMITTGE